MATIKVSGLAETTSPQTSDELLLNQSGVSKKLKVGNFVNAAITANTAKVTNATHSGEVTGSGALTIADNIVDEANLKVSNSPTNGFLLSAQSGNTGGLTWITAPATSTADIRAAAKLQFTATSNIGLGTNAVDSITTGDYNVGLGLSSLTTTTSGSNNVGLGVLALRTNTTKL